MNLLLVEDEYAQRQILEKELTKLGNEVVAVETGAEAVSHLEHGTFDVAVTDLQLPDFDGIEVIRRARAAGNNVPILVITAYASLKTAVSAIQAGATDYLIKPIRAADLARRLQQLNDLDHLHRENRLLRRVIQQDAKRYWFPETPAGQQLVRLVSKVGSTDLPVLITGESGTGKGMTARLLHAASPRADGPFLSINCGALRENLIESEFFGYLKGAFTGATESHSGLFDAAARGTLFLDEVSSLDSPMQAKLLQAIEEKAIRPVGSTTEHEVDVRIIAATGGDLDEMVLQGVFREDLAFRLKVFQVSLPPLREQREAISAAVDFFMTKHAGLCPHQEITITSAAWDLILAHDWPGNLRELENAVERVLVLCEAGEITPADLPPTLQLSGDARPALADAGLKQRVTIFERMTILQTIERCQGDRQKAADSLGIGLSTLYRKLDRNDHDT